MKLLKLNYRIFNLLCICPPDESCSQLIKFRNIIVLILNILLMFIGCFCSVIFIAKYFSVDLENSLGAGFQVGAATPTFYTIIAALILRDDIMKIFIDIQMIYELNKDKESSKCLLEAKRYIEWLIKFAIKYFTIAFPACQFLQLLGSALYSYITYGYFNNDILYRPYKLALPWNKNTFSGWLAEACLSVCISTSFLFSNPSFLLFFVSICEYHRAFYEMFRVQCIEIGTIARDKSRGHYYEVKKCIHETIIFHNLVKEFFNHTAQVYSTFILIQLICGMIFLASAIFQMDLVIHDLNVQVVLMLFAVTCSGLTLSLYCFYGKYTTDSYFAFAAALYDSDWIILPNNLQRYYIMMIANAQKIVSYHGYNIVSLNMETFAKMLKTVITYYLMFKTLTSK